MKITHKTQHFFNIDPKSIGLSKTCGHCNNWVKDKSKRCTFCRSYFEGIKNDYHTLIEKEIKDYVKEIDPYSAQEVNLSDFDYDWKEYDDETVISVYGYNYYDGFNRYMQPEPIFQISVLPGGTYDII